MARITPNPAATNTTTAARTATNTIRATEVPIITRDRTVNAELIATIQMAAPDIPSRRFRDSPTGRTVFSVGRVVNMSRLSCVPVTGGSDL